MNIFKILNVKQSDFRQGWAEFDSIEPTQLFFILANGAELSKDKATQSILSLLKNFLELNCFGRVSDLGHVVLEGFCGFPKTDECVNESLNISETAFIRKIDNAAIFVDFVG